MCRLHRLHVHEGPRSVNPLALGHMMLVCRGYRHPMLIRWSHAVHSRVMLLGRRGIIGTLDMLGMSSWSHRLFMVLGDSQVLPNPFHELLVAPLVLAPLGVLVAVSRQTVHGRVLGYCAMGKGTMNSIIFGSGGQAACGLVRALFGGGGVTDRDRDGDDVPASEACWPPDTDSPSLLNREDSVSERGD